MENWEKNILLFLVSQTISLFGSSLVQYAMMWYITLQTQSGIMLTISIICSFVPTFFLSPFAGVWADRYNRKFLIAASDSMIAIATLILAILFISGYDAIWLLFVISAVRSLGAAVQLPAVGAYIPQLVPEDKLTRVNAINTTIQSVLMLVAPMVSGVLLSIASIESIFFIDVVTAALAVFILLFYLHVPAHSKAQEKQKPSYMADMRLGIEYINNHVYIKKFFIFLGAYLFMIAPIAFLSPLQVARSFGSDVWRLTAVEIAFSAGMVLGGLLMASWSGLKNRTYTMVLSVLSGGVFIFMMGAVHDFYVYLAFMALCGISVPIFDVPSIVMIQEKVEESYMGRVLGVMNMIMSSTLPIAMLLFGPLADYIRIEWMLMITGALIVLEGFLLAFSRDLVEAGKPKSFAVG